MDTELENFFGKHEAIVHFVTFIVWSHTGISYVNVSLYEGIGTMPLVRQLLLWHHHLSVSVIIMTFGAHFVQFRGGAAHSVWRQYIPHVEFSRRGDWCGEVLFFLILLTIVLIFTLEK